MDMTIKPFNTLESVCAGAAIASVDVKANLIIVFSYLGYTANLISKYRPAVPVIVATKDKQQVY